MIYELKNDSITVLIDSKGAEVKSAVKDGTEYMWCGDSKYWGRTSPVLFPFVGSLKDGTYDVGGRKYLMGQHGFARDMEFDLASKSDNSIIFSLCSNAETLKKYPFGFELKIKYTLIENVMTVAWEVNNPGNEVIHFSIGAHPAFMCPLNNNGTQSDYKLKFNTSKDIEYYLLKGGLVDKTKTYSLVVKDEYANIIQGMFDHDALIIEGKQASKISLCHPNGREYVTVKTDAPLFGLWSPAGKSAPFICIEPWYGRCDSVDFAGELSEREYSNLLASGEVFNAEYFVEFN